MRGPILLAYLLLASGASGIMIPPQSVPTDRLLKTAQQNVIAHPDDPDAHYALGRIRYAMYCADDPRALGMYADGPSFRFPDPFPASWEFKNIKLKSDPATRRLVLSAIGDLRAALRLDKGREPGLYALTLACVYEAAAPIAKEIKPAASKALWQDRAYGYYARAFAAARPGDLSKGGGMFDLISQEAGTAMLRIKPEERKEEILAHLKKMDETPRPVTPIVFSLDGPRSLAELLDPARTARFDLDGSGRPQTYPWVRPDTAFLVWQPDAGVPVTSGRQLFGSATWWMMYRDGYAALAALDVDQNGWIEGRELSDLGVWRDANANGVADPGETMPVGALGVRGLSTKITGHAGASLVSAAGLRTADGRVLPTYDWVTQPL